MKERNNCIDTLRFIGCLAVIVLHCHLKEIPEGPLSVARLLSRWAVPYFFMVSGYFFFSNFTKDNDKAFLKVFKNLLSIFIIANLVFLPIGVLRSLQHGGITSLISYKTLISGNFHLWFLGSMIFGYVTVWFMLSLGWHRWLTGLSIVIVLLFLAGDSYHNLFHIQPDVSVLRFLISIPSIYLGYICGKYEHLLKLPIYVPIALLIAGTGLQFAEAHYLTTTGYPAIRHQFLIGTLLMSFSLLLLSFKLVISDNVFSKIGRKYSLLIYIYHPVIVLGMAAVIAKLGNNAILLWMEPLLVLIITTLLIWLMDKKTPSIYNFVTTGKLQKVQVQ